MVREQIDIYKLERYVNRLLSKIRTSKEVGDKTKKALLKYYNYLKIGRALSSFRVYKKVSIIFRFFLEMGKDPEEITREDIENFLLEIESKDYSPETLRDYRNTIKEFFTFYYENKPKNAKNLVGWIKTNVRYKRKSDLDVLTEEEIERMIKSAGNPRDKAFIGVLYETGGRIGEILPLKIRDIIDMENYYIIHLFGKTGERLVVVKQFYPELHEWLSNYHPFRNFKESFIWIRLTNPKPNVFVSYQSIAQRLKKIARNAGIKKNIYPHLFRHSRATILAKSISEQELKAYMGWTAGTKMLDTYIHIKGREAIKSVLEKVYKIKEGLKKRSMEDKMEKIKSLLMELIRIIDINDMEP